MSALVENLRNALVGILRNPLSLGVAAVLWVSSGSPALAQRVNIAKFQPAVASSVNTSYLADFATDGIVSNFHSLRTNLINNNFFTLEFTYPRPVTVASAHLYSGLFESASPTQVMGSHRYQYHDGSAWVTITSVLNNTAPELSTVFPRPVTATRFRLLGINNGLFAIRELAFFPPNPVDGIEQGYPLGTDVTLNLAHKRPTASSSAHLTNSNGPGYARNAVDGHLDNRSRWLVNPVNNVYPVGESLEVDLLSLHAVGSAHVYSGVMNAARVSSSPIPDFTLQSWDGTAWVAIPGATITGNTQAARAIEFTSPVSTSRVRLVTTGATPARIQELLLFPPRAGGHPLGLGVINAAPSTDTFERHSDSFHQLVNVGSGLKLSLVHGSVVASPGDPEASERTEWQLLLNYRDGTYRIRNAVTGLHLALSEISMAGGLPVVAESYSALPHQDWRLVYDATDPSRLSLANAYSGLVLQPLDNSAASGTSMVVVAASSASTFQQWKTTLRRHHPKKGIAATNALIGTRYTAAPGLTIHQDFFNRLSGNWSYSWNRQTSDTFPYLPADFGFNPMVWGGDSAWDHAGSDRIPVERIHRDLQSNGKAVALLGYNEPDSSQQGAVDATVAVKRWPRFEAFNVPLVAPAAANPYSQWFIDFVAGVDAEGHRRDYTAVHMYHSPNADFYINRLTQIHNDYGRPVWVTEFGNTRWSGTARWTDGDSYNFLAEFMWRAESLPWLKRYSIFGYIEEGPDAPPPVSPDPPEAPRSNIIRYDGSLTPLGELYAGWDGVAAVVHQRAYHLHNKKEYRRVRNPGLPATAPTDLVASESPEGATDGAQWFLIPGTTADTVRIISTRDGRRLRYFNGTYVGLAPATNFTSQSEWRLVESEHGWFFLAHPQSGVRLRIDASGTLLHGSGSATGDEYQWRFIRPAIPDIVGVPDPFAVWTSEKLSARPPVDQSPAADPDADGLTNLVEYAFDRDPLAPDASPLQSRITNPGLQLSFLRARADVTYEVLASSSLEPGSWITIATNPGDVSRTVPVVVTDNRPVSGKRFLRIRVTR